MMSTNSNPQPQTVRMVHFSDIHVSAQVLGWRRSDWFSKRVGAWINYRWLGRRFRFRHADQVLAALAIDMEQQAPDHVIFTGDATALGFASEIERAAEFLFGSKDRPKFPGLAVPGNHDYCTKFAAASGAFERSFAPWQVGIRVDNEIYPFAQQVGPVWLIGVNSSTANRWPWDASGQVGAAQLDRLRRLLQVLEPGPRVLITHYPVASSSGRPEHPSRHLRDLRDVLAVAEAGGVSLWLHGHNHKPYVLNPGPACFPVICAGSTTQTNRWVYTKYAFSAETVQVQRRIFDNKQQAFVDGIACELRLTNQQAAISNS